MSRERCLSLDRAQGRKQNLSVQSGVYIPERSPNRTQLHAALQHAHNTLDISGRNCGGANGDKSIICFPINNVEGSAEYLEDFEEPSFYNLPPNSSFDEVMCIMATPPSASHQSAPTVTEKLDADVVKLNDLRKRMAPHIGASGEDQEGVSVQVDDVRKRIATAIVQRNQELPKISPLPEDPYDIPPPPKNPKDVVATIRRARAIARLRALEEEKAPTEPDRNSKKRVRGIAVQKKYLKQAPTLTKSESASATKLPEVDAPQKTGVPKKITQPRKPQPPPDYVTDEWAAAILRTRNLAGLRTANPQLIPKQETSRSSKPKSPLRLATSPAHARTPTIENIMERVAAIRSRTYAAQASLAKEERNLLTPTPQDELDEFEALEELYGADNPEQYSSMQQSATDLQKRIDALKQHLLQTPPTTEHVTENELDEFEELEEQYGARMPEQYPSMQQTATDLQHQINALKQKLLQTPPLVKPTSEEKVDEYEDLDIASELPSVHRYQDLLHNREAMAAAAAEIALRKKPEYVSPARTGTRSPTSTTPQRSRSPVAAAQSRLPKFDEAFLENIDKSEFTFSAEALKDAGFEIGDEISLGEISMPDFDEDISFDELGIEDISVPDLQDLSISGDDLAIEPDYPLDISREVDEEHAVTKQSARDDTPEDTGFLTSIVNAVVDRLKNIFSPSGDVLNVAEETGVNLDTSLPNMFESTPPPKPKPSLLQLGPEKPTAPKTPVTIPPHPKDPKDYTGIVQRARAIQKKKTAEATIAAASAPIGRDKRERREIISTIPKKAPTLKKKIPRQKEKKRVYPPGEYSPSDTKAVARARSLAGLKNLSDLLNPERVARIAEQKALREAEEVAIDALPPVERMREKIKRMRKSTGEMPRPSIEALATLEAIRANLPKPKSLKRKWRPAGRLKVDRRVHPSERLFRHDYGRVLVPTKKTQKKLGWKPIDVLSPIAEETQFKDGDFIQFSPLKPHEGRLRLRYLKEQAARQTAEAIRAAEENQAAISYQTTHSRRIASHRIPEVLQFEFSPIQMRSPTSPRTEETRREKIVRKIGPHGGPETVREEVTEISTIENGEVHTSLRQVTTKTDEYGNVTRHVQKGKGFTGEEEAILEDLADIEPPDFLDTSDIPAPSDLSIPTPAEIINRIRSNVQQRLSLALPNIPQSSKSPLPASPGKIDFPQNLTDEELFDIETPEFERTPQKASPQVQTFSPVERDLRMYAWGEVPTATPPLRTQRSKGPSQTAEPAKLITPSPKPKSPEGIPPHPKDSKDYKGMIKRAQAIQKLKLQVELAAKTALAKQDPSKSGRVPISRWTGPPPRDPRRRPRNKLVLKKRVPKVSPKNIGDQRLEYEDMEFPSDPPQLSEEYRRAVARARLIHGLENRTAALNPAVAAKLAAEEADQAAFDALPEVEKIKRRMEKLRERPAKKRHFEPSADILGALAAIRANMSPLEDVLQQPSPHRSLTGREPPLSSQAMSPKTPITEYRSQNIAQAPMRARSRVTASMPLANTSLEEFELMEQYMGAMPIIPEVKSPSQPHGSSPGHRPIMSPVAPSDFIDHSLEEFENLEAELKSDKSLEEFETQEAEAKKIYHYDTPKRSEHHRPRQLVTPPIRSTTTALIAPSMRMLGQAGYFQDIELSDEESLPESEAVRRPHTTPTPHVDPGSIYYDLMEDFRVPVENVLETSQLMPKTPPRNIQERLQRLKEAQSVRTYEEPSHETPAATALDFSPIRLISPSSVGEHEQLTSSISIQEENEWLINIDEAPEGKIHAVKQLRDLDDIPFDELEYEAEPSLPDISFEKPLSPPPRPSDIIRRIKHTQHQQLKESTRPPTPKSPEALKLPEEFPDEELFELSAPSFTQTPRTPPLTYISPRVSLPIAYGEVRPTIPAAPTQHKQTPIKEPTPRSLGKNVKDKSFTPESSIVIPPHPQHPKDYAAMIRRARAIHKLNKQKEAEAQPPLQSVGKDRVPISRWQGPPPKKTTTKPRKKLVLKKRVQKPVATADEKSDIQQPSVPEEERGYAEPPPLPQEYRDAVATARLLRGLKNRTAALNPKIAAKVAAKKAAEEAAAAAFNALPEIEKIKVRMAGLRRKPHRRHGIKPTVEQMAYLEALKLIAEYQTSSPETLSKSRTPLRISLTPRSRTMTRSLSLTPRPDFKEITDAESRELAELAEFESLEQLDKSQVLPPTVTQDFALQQSIDDLKSKLLEAEEFPQIEDESLAEFEALEALEDPPVQHPAQPVTPLDISKLVSDLRQHLVTPPRVDPRERYRQLIAQRKSPTIPIVSPVESPEIRYSPIRLPSSPSRAEKSTSQITRSGNRVIKERVIETSEMIDGQLQQFKTLITTTTDSQGNVTSQINESKRVSARDRSAELESAEDLGDIEEPSFLDTTPLTPLERPRPRDIIDRVGRQLKESYRPEVPTGHLIELRTPPRMLPLPTELPEEKLLNLSYPLFERTPSQSPVRSPTRSPMRPLDVSIPQVFAATPPPPTPPLPPVSPLRYRIPSPEGPIVIPGHPKDPTDYKAMVRRARKIQELMEAEARAAEEAEAEAAVMAAAEAAKPKKKERVPISRWTAPPPRKPGRRKKLVMKKRGEVMATKTTAKKNKLEEEIEHLEEPLALPEHFAKEVALARKLAGLKYSPAALRPKVAAGEAAKAEATRKAYEAEGAHSRSPIKDYAAVLSRINEMKEKGAVVRNQPSLASAAYLDALKGAMQVRQELQHVPESPKTRYERILAARSAVPSPTEESPIRTPTHEEIHYSPVRFSSPRIGDNQMDLPESLRPHKFDIADFENLDEMEELSVLEQPTYFDFSQQPIDENQYTPLTPPTTPPPVPSALISRIRQQYEQEKAAVRPQRLTSPETLEFPEDLPEELFPYASLTPPTTPPPVPPPLISRIRQQYEKEKAVVRQQRLTSPETLEFPEDLPEEELFELSAPSFAQSPIKAETPIKSPNITIPYYFEESPPPARSPTAAMMTDDINATSPPLLGVFPGIRVKTPQGPIIIPRHPKDPTDVAAMIRRAQLIQKLRAKESAEKASAAKAAKVRVPISRRMPKKSAQKKGKLISKPTEPPKLPTDYLAQVARARRLAGLKPKTTPTTSSTQTQVAPPKPSYATLMESYAALRRAKQKIQQVPTARELAYRQHLINRKQRQERRRALYELERLRQQQGFEFEPTKTPPTARERLQAIKSRIPFETSTSSVYPYSPVKTPEVIDVPQYQPISLAKTPPYQFLKNARTQDIENISMPLDDIDNTTDFDTADEEDIEFQLAELANMAFHENVSIPELDRAEQNDFDIAERIKMLQHQLLQSPNTANVDVPKEYNMAERMELLKNQLLQTPTQQELLVNESIRDLSNFDEDDEHNNQQHIYDDVMADFEEMERQYL